MLFLLLGMAAFVAFGLVLTLALCSAASMGDRHLARLVAQSRSYTPSREGR
ncbi:hypothetical protein WM014_08480 [Bifidobacterium mongoliense]|uniref:hypothetical protein n=1 Tax=Bifidobacterium mongoliense TaxID=518643 RepID=UPI0030EF0B4F